MENKRNRKVEITLGGPERPSKGTQWSAGLDIPSQEQITLRPFETKRIPTYITVKMPLNHCALLTIRANMALRGISLATGVEIIDPDLNDPITLLIRNNSDKYATILPGETLAQLVIIPNFKGPYLIEKELPLWQLIGENPLTGEGISDHEMEQIEAGLGEDHYWEPVHIRNLDRSDVTGPTE